MIVKNVSNEWRIQTSLKSCRISSQSFFKKKSIWTGLREFMEDYQFMEKMRYIYSLKDFSLNSWRCKISKVKRPLLY